MPSVQRKNLIDALEKHKQAIDDSLYIKGPGQKLVQSSAFKATETTNAEYMKARQDEKDALKEHERIMRPSQSKKCHLL